MGKRPCSGPTRFEGAPAHPLSQQLPENGSLPAKLRNPQQPQENINLSVPLCAQTPPGTSSLTAPRFPPHGAPTPGGSPTRAGLQISAATAPPAAPPPRRRRAVHAGTCGPRPPPLSGRGGAGPSHIWRYTNTEGAMLRRRHLTSFQRRSSVLHSPDSSLFSFSREAAACQLPAQGPCCAGAAAPRRHLGCDRAG